MATEVWWLDPPRSYKAGGYLTYKEYELDVDEVYIHNNRYYVGFQCVKQNSFPADLISDRYESWSYHSFIKFPVPTLASGVFASAELNLMLNYAKIILNITATYMDVDIYYRNIEDPDDFPWQVLDEDDYPSGSWEQNPYSIENMMDMYGDYLTEGPCWLDPVNVTEAVQKAIDEGWEWIAIQLTPNYEAPLDWDYDHRPTSYDQEVYVGFYGPVNSYWVASPSGFPDAACSPCPWLKLTYSGGVSQWYPGEDVTTSGQGSGINCVAADPKARAAIVGTDTGNLWYSWYPQSGEVLWDKIIDGDDPITAVWMDNIRNLVDFTDDQISWYGTSGGMLYKSIDSLTNFDFVTTFSTAVREIMSSDQDSNKVVVGVDSGVWVSINGGETWEEALAAPTE